MPFEGRHSCFLVFMFFIMMHFKREFKFWQFYKIFGSKTLERKQICFLIIYIVIVQSIGEGDVKITHVFVNQYIVLSKFNVYLNCG